MRKWIAILLNLPAMASIAVAGETLPVLKAGNEVYSNATIMSVSVTDIYFTSSRGLANAKLKDLDPDLQKHFNYNPTNAVAAEQRQKAGNALYHVEIMKPSPVNQAANDEVAADRAAIRQPGTGKALWARSFLNQKMPEFVVEKWLNGEPDHRGKFVLIDFWATWCAQCRAAIPMLNDFQRKFGSRMIIVGLTDEPGDVVKKMSGTQMEYYVATDSLGRTKKAMEISGIPHMVIVDPQGIVRWEGFPFLPGYELTDKVVVDIINQYSR
jgi:thiol-disulfide isomerase/thioredoxin